LIGGLASETIKEISVAQIEFEKVVWKKVNYFCQPQLQIEGRQSHSTVPYQDKLYIFGGCFAFNRKRHIRECTNQVLEFDSTSKEISVVLTHGVSISARQSHTAVAFKQSMVVYGGISESGVLHQDMLAFNFEEREWTRVKVTGSTGNHFY